MMRHLNY